MEAALQTHQVIITILLTMLGFAGGVGVSHFGIVRQLNRVKTQVAVQDTIITGLKEKEDTCLNLHQETLGLVREVINQNNLLINQLIADNRTRVEAR